MNNYNPEYGYNSDLEANLVRNNEYQEQQRDQYGDQQGNPPAAVSDFRTDLNYSIKYNVFLLSIYLSKIIASSVILAVATTCIGAREGWVIMMIVHDVLYSSSLLATISLVKKLNQEIARIQRQITSRSRQNTRNNLAVSAPPHNRKEKNNQELPAEGNLIRSSSEANQDQLQNQAAANVLEQQLQDININMQLEILARERIRRQMTISKLSGSAEMLYIILFIVGQFLLFLSDEGQCKSKAVSTLMLVYIILGYLWLLMPIIFILLACLCLPVLLFCFFMFGGRGTQVAANRDLINSLPVKKFTNDLPGDHECAICMTDYSPEDNIVQFKCSPMHYFHEDCIKRWLEVNGECPLCRARVDGMDFQATENNNNNA